MQRAEPGLIQGLHSQLVIEEHHGDQYIQQRESSNSAQPPSEADDPPSFPIEDEAYQAFMIPFDPSLQNEEEQVEIKLERFEYEVVESNLIMASNAPSPNDLGSVELSQQDLSAWEAYTMARRRIRMKGFIFLFLVFYLDS